MRTITAHSTPVIDDWGPDLSWMGFGEAIWSAQEWIEWYNEMKNTFGKEVATKTFAEWFDALTIGASEYDYLNNDSFKQLVISEGIVAKSSIMQKIYAFDDAVNSIAEPFKNIWDSVTNATEALKNTTGSLKYIAPLALAAVAIILLVSVSGKIKTAVA